MADDNQLKYFCAGVGLGVAAAFLFAPKSGPESRVYLQTITKDGADYLKAQAASALDAVSDAVERGSKKIRYQKENVAAAMEAGKAAFDEAEAATPVLRF